MDQMYRNAQNVMIPLYAQSIGSSFGAGLTGVVFNSPNLKSYYVTDTVGTPVNIPLRAGINGTYLASGLVAADIGSAPGDYWLSAPNAMWSHGGNYTTLSLYGRDNMLPIKMKFYLIDAPIGTVSQSGIKSNSFAPMTELSVVPTGWPMSFYDSQAFMAMRSIHKTLTLSNVNPSGGADVIYKSDNTTPLGSGTYADDGQVFTRNKYGL